MNIKIIKYELPKQINTEKEKAALYENATQGMEVYIVIYHKLDKFHTTWILFRHRNIQ